MQRERTAIFGPGLIGGSVALAARRGGRRGPLVLWSRDADEREAVRRLAWPDTGVTDDPLEAARGARLIVLCTPPGALAGLASRIAPFLEPDAAVCDVASVKAGVAEELTAIFERPGGSRYVGAHPMAGAERSGLAAARADLFDGCVCLLTPLDGRTAPDALAAVADFWEGLGARTRQMTPGAHDEAVAAVSHLPHVLAAALAGWPGEDARACAGPGWRDMTRVAAGSPELWTEILSRNRAPVTKALQTYIERLRGVGELLESGREADLEGFLHEAKTPPPDVEPQPNVREKAIPIELRVRRAPLIQAEVSVPGDKSISHRAVMFASLSNGVCVIHDFSAGEDCWSTVKAMRALGVQIDQPESEPTTLIVHGRYRQLGAPSKPIDCGNSGTTMRLLAGLLAGQPFRSRLIGDASLSARPMNRIMGPLTEMGAHITAEGEGGRAPLVIEGGALRGIDYHLPMASAQVKSAVLLAGLYASGETSVTEPGQSRDHTERLLRYFLIKLQQPEARELADGEPNRITIKGGQMPESRNFTVPGDISSAAFWLAAAAAQPGARLLVKKIGLNDTRTGVLSVLLRMGAHVHEVVEDIEQIEPTGTVEVKGARLHGTVIEGREIPNVIDEIPILAVLGALAVGQTVIRNAAELRVKETDRLRAVTANLKAMGAQVEEYHDGLVITGGHPLHGARLPSFGDHRIAMAFAIAGLFAEGETVIEDTACIETSYPGFAETLEGIIASSTTGAPLTPVISDARKFLPPEDDAPAAGKSAKAR